MQSERPEFDPCVQKVPWRKEWLPASVFLSEEFHGQKSLVSYSPWVCKELDMIEKLTLLVSYLLADGIIRLKLC